MIRLKKILVATDFGESSEAALMYGRDLARGFDATLDVLHVVQHAYMQFGTEAYVSVLPDLQRDVEDAAKTRLQALLGDEDRTALHATPVILTSSAPASAIVDYANEARIDLIIMGTHGRGTVAHMLMGSVAERVVRTAPCPVLTVRHPEREFVLPDALVAVATA
jgi:nucleotide-binding universal stress UspA family protein